MTSLEDTLKFLSLPNSCPLCIVVLNPKTGQPISVNSTFESIFGPIYKFKEWEFANAASGDDISPEEGTKKIDESNINREKFREAIDKVRSSLSSSDPTSSSNDNGDNKKESSTKIRNVEMLTLGTNDAGLPVRKYFDWTIGSVNMQQPITFDDNDNTSHITSAVILYGDMVNEEESSDRARDAELIDFFQNAPIAMHWLNGDGTVLWANQTELNVLGYTAEEYIGQPIMNFCPDEKELVLEIFKQLGSGNAIADVPVRFRTKDGKLVHLLIDSNVAYNKDGSFGHTRCFIRDDTARKIRDARSKLLLEETERSLRMLDGFLSRTLHHVMGPLHALRSTCEVVRDNLGSINTSNDESVQNCDLLERAAETVMTTTRMVADVSDLARLDEGSVLKTKFDSVDIRDVGLEAIESIQFNALRLSGGDDGISVSLNLIGDGGPSNVRTDRTVLLRVLAHILENAVREVDSGGKVILQIKSVGTSSSKVPGVFVEVIDDGKGLPVGTCLDKGGNLKNAPSNRYVTGNLKLSSQDPDQIQKARMEMERELQDLKQNGVGVGLPLSYHLVNALGGELRHDTSYAGKGTRVWFVLPESSMEADDKATLLKTENIPKKGGRPPANIVINIEGEQASKRRRISENKFSTFVSSDGSHSSGRDDDTFATSLSHKPAPEAVAKCGVKASMPFSVLIVEDTDICARLLAMQLKKMKCSTQRAENGQVAVDLLKSSLEGTFDLVLMDLRMPVMDGLEATKLIRNELQMGDLPIVALTGEMSADIKSECESIGFNSFYQKPLKKDKLQEIIKMYKTSRDEGEDKE